MNKIITVLLILMLSGITGCTSSNNTDKLNFEGKRDFQIDEETKSEIVFFFENTSDTSEIKKYCEENRFYCSYYCRDINQNHEVCNILPERGERRFPNLNEK